MKRVFGAAAAALLLTACKAPALRPTAPAAPVESLASMPVEQLASAVADDARRSDAEPDAKIREQLAADAERNAQACLDRAPQAAACLYYHAIALGLEARAHPLHAGETLKSMLNALGAAEAADAQIDEAGPVRVKALVLIKAPAWPLGPGDPDAGLAAARQAVSLRPQYPPNALALAEALAKTGDIRGAREAYARARDLSQPLPASKDRDDWLRQAEQSLSKLAAPSH
ncbi:MAG TPA: tetratricopeptide repeat protein [Steroidobacteraceae bacterium]|nr:tetratricopeptide repeat protein [Steroidobacteraceae bacterium]